MPEALHYTPAGLPARWLVHHKLAEAELTADLAFGAERTAHDAGLGWKHRHHGLDSPAAHALGAMAQRVVAAWLAQEGVAYREAPRLADQHDALEWPFTITNRGEPFTLGVKTQNVSELAEAFRGFTWYYPDKNHPTASDRVLGYPDYLVQAAATTAGGDVWLLGVAARHQVEHSSAVLWHGESCHLVPHSAYMEPARALAHWRLR